VQKATEDCLKKAAQEGGFILSTGCDVPLETPEQNLHELVITAIGDRAPH